MASAIGKWISENRKKSGLSQQDLANKLGVYQPQVSDWETDKAKPSYDVLQKIAATFGVDFDEKALGISPPLGEWIRRKREEMKLSRAQLANKAGISDITIYFIETGRTQSPQQSTLHALEKILGELPKQVEEEVEEERSLEEFQFLGPFPLGDWENNIGTEKVSCIYVFYDQLMRPVRIGQTDDLRRRLKEYVDNYWWFRSPTAETFAYVIIKDPDFREKTEKIMIKLVGQHAIFNTREKLS